MTMIAGVDDNIGDEDLKEEIMRCFSNAPTAIGVLRGIRQRQNEQAQWYKSRIQPTIYFYNCKTFQISIPSVSTSLSLYEPSK